MYVQYSLERRSTLERTFTWRSERLGSLGLRRHLPHTPCSTLRREVKLGTDVAASEFYDADAKTYNLDFKNPGGAAAAAPEMKKTGEEMIGYYQEWLNKSRRCRAV